MLCKTDFLQAQGYGPAHHVVHGGLGIVAVEAVEMVVGIHCAVLLKINSAGKKADGGKSLVCPFAAYAFAAANRAR